MRTKESGEQRLETCFLLLWLSVLENCMESSRAWKVGSYSLFIF